MKPLPYIAIEGVGKTKEEVLDSLIAIEPLLVMMGYNVPDEETNNRRCSYLDYCINHLMVYEEKNMGYHNHSGTNPDIRFKSTEINKLIKYMIDNKFIK